MTKKCHSCGVNMELAEMYIMDAHGLRYCGVPCAVKAYGLRVVSEPKENDEVDDKWA